MDRLIALRNNEISIKRKAHRSKITSWYIITFELHDGRWGAKKVYCGKLVQPVSEVVSVDALLASSSYPLGRGTRLVLETLKGGVQITNDSLLQQLLDTARGKILDVRLRTY
jgi:hypothetical protein